MKDGLYGSIPVENEVGSSNTLHKPEGRVPRVECGRESTTVDTKRRSLAKALSWRVIAWCITASIAYLFTGKVAFALSIGFADSLLKIFAYYLHERSWMSIDYGRVPPVGYVTESNDPKLAGAQPVAR